MRCCRRCAWPPPWRSSRAPPTTTTTRDIDVDTELEGESEITPAPGVVPGEEAEADGSLAYVIPLTVAEEIPAPTGADGASGEATLDFDAETNGLTGSITTSDLSGPPQAAHIHEGALGETGPVLIPFVEDGTGTGFVLPTDTVLNEEQVTLLRNGELYVNVHTELNGSGEIRGQIVEQDPEG